MTPEQIASACLTERIAAMRDYIDKAQERLEYRDYLQAAVRLQKAAEQAHFGELVMRFFESASPKGEE